MVNIRLPRNGFFDSFEALGKAAQSFFQEDTYDSGKRMLEVLEKAPPARELQILLGPADAAKRHLTKLYSRLGNSAHDEEVARQTSALTSLTLALKAIPAGSSLSHSQHRAFKKLEDYILAPEYQDSYTPTKQRLVEARLKAQDRIATWPDNGIRYRLQTLVILIEAFEGIYASANLPCTGARSARDYCIKSEEAYAIATIAGVLIVIAYNRS